MSIGAKAFNEIHSTMIPRESPGFRKEIPNSAWPSTPKPGKETDANFDFMCVLVLAIRWVSPPNAKKTNHMQYRGDTCTNAGGTTTPNNQGNGCKFGFCSVLVLSICWVSLPNAKKTKHIQYRGDTCTKNQRDKTAKNNARNGSNLDFVRFLVVSVGEWLD